MERPFPWSFGDYEVLAVIETTAGATSYRARQRALDRIVTLTILPPDEARKPTWKTCFDRRFLAASRLRHPNVVAAIDAGELDGHRFIVSEDAGGRRLAEALAAKEWFPRRRCVGIALDVAQALVHLESHRIVHRAVSPQAIVLAESGVAKLRGFSIAKEAVQDGSETWYDLDVEVARYTAPEIAGAERGIDARADVYALGAVLYHMLTGRPPYDGPTAAAILLQHVKADVPDPRALREDVSDALADLVLRCLAKDRAQRFPGPRPLVEALTAVAAARPAAGPGRPGWRRPRAR